MNSFPSISHHLFVAAIGNEGSSQDRPIRQLRPADRAPAPAPATTLNAMVCRRPIVVGHVHLLEWSPARARD